MLQTFSREKKKMDDDFVIIAAASILMVVVCLKRRKKIRRYWVNKYLRGRKYHGRYNDVSKMISKIKSIKFKKRNNFIIPLQDNYKSNICIHVFQFDDLKGFPPSFQENFHMTNREFDDIYIKIKKHLEPVKYSRPDVIPPRAKLAMVLE